MKLFNSKLLNKKNLIDWILLVWFAIICTLGPNLLSKVFIPPTARLLFALLLVVITALIFTKGIKLYQVKFDSLIQLLLLSFIIYVIGLVIGSISDSSEGFSIRSLVSHVSRFYVFGIVFFSSNSRLIKKYLNLYSNFLLILAFLSIILWFLLITNSISPIETFTNHMGGDRERVYQNYGIGLMETKFLAAENITLPRVGSFYDEPGTFGMMLLPALYWSIWVNKNILKTFIISLAILLSFSVGTWLTLTLSILISIVFVSKKWLVIKINTIKIIFTFFVIGLMITIALNIVSLVSDLDSLNWIVDYASRKLSNINSGRSEGAISRRVEDLLELSRVLMNHPLGFGANNQIQQEIDRFSIGFVGNVVRTGIIGLLSQLITYLSLTLMVLRSFNISGKSNKSDQLKALSLSILSFMIMSFQRISFLSFFSGIFICALFAREYSEQITKK